MEEHIDDQYEIILRKYFNRGYGIVFPFLNISNKCDELFLLNLHIKIYYINDNIIIGDINLKPLNLLNPTLFGNINNNYVLKKNLLNKNQENYKQLIQKNDNFQYSIYNAHCSLNLNKLTQPKISDIINIDIYINWLYEHIQQNIILNSYDDKYTINKTFIEIIFGPNYMDIIDINQLGIELNELIKRLNIYYSIDNQFNKLYILNDIINKIILHETKKYECINNMLINWSIDIAKNAHYQTYNKWYNNNFNNKIKYSKHSLNTIKENIKNHIDNITDINICSICLEKMHYLTPNIVKLTCGHICHEYHSAECRGINLWLEKNNSCPECRKTDPKENNLKDIF